MLYGMEVGLVGIGSIVKQQLRSMGFRIILNLWIQQKILGINIERLMYVVCLLFMRDFRMLFVKQCHADCQFYVVQFVTTLLL